jgi:uncharacterized protein YbjT (DUF2867 family)
MEISKSEKTALVLGATGLVGTFLVDQLLAHPAYAKVRILVRSRLPREHPRLEQQLVDFDHLDRYRKLFKVQDLFLCLGTTLAKAGSKEAFRKIDYGYNFTAAELAAEQGANQVLLVSSVGADAEALFFYAQVKGELEAAIQQLPFWGVRIFQPSFLLGERTEERWGERIATRIARVVDNFTGNLLSRYRPVEAEYVAAAMVAEAQSLHGGVSVITSDEIPKLAKQRLLN